MGASLTIYSPVPGSGKTVAAYLLAHRLSGLLGKSAGILVCCTCMSEGDTLSLAGAGADIPTLEDLVNAGIPAAGKGTNIKELLYHLDNLYFIDSSKATPLFVLKNEAGYQKLMRHLKEIFELVIMDTSSDPGNPLSHMAVENSDNILNIMVQDMKVLKKHSFAGNHSLACIINRYADIYPDKREITSLLKIKYVFTLPFCTQLQEMKNRDQLFRYAELDTGYMKAMDRLAGFLIKELDLPQAEKKEGGSFMQFLRRRGAL